MAAALAPAADKLPLAVKKDVRDKWEAKKAGFEKELSDLLGQPWTITTNAGLVYANTADSSFQPRVGEVISWYIARLVDNVRDFVAKFGDDGKAELNATFSQHVVDFGPQGSTSTATSFQYGGLVVEDGALKLVYAPRYFAANTDTVSQDISGVLKSAAANATTTKATTENDSSSQAYNLVARKSVRDQYDSKVDAVRDKIASLTGVKDIKLTPNFEANAAALSKSKESRSDWDSILGKVTLSYFDGLAYQLERAGFANDDLLQEGFQEAVPKQEIALRVVDKLDKGTYHEVLISDGALVVQATPKYWWANVSDVGQNILDLL